MNYDKFFIGINIIVLRDKKILLGKRKNIAFDGGWGMPGGHLENNEKLEQAAARELFEETGLKCDSFIFSNIVNQFNNEGGHYLQIAFVAQNLQGEPVLSEPDKCHGWEWFDLEDLPENLIEPHKSNIEGFLKNRNFIED